MPQKAIHGLTHKELVRIAARWLKNTQKCSVVISEMISAASETPDAVGWRSGFSVLVECKASLDDFRRDKEKSFRKAEKTGLDFGMGNRRYYMTPEGLLSSNNLSRLPKGWGLLEVDIVGRVRVKVEADRRIQTSMSLRNEMRLILSDLRRRQEND